MRSLVEEYHVQKSVPIPQDEIARIRKRKHGRNMLNRSGNTTDNLCFRYRFRDVFSRFRCCVYNGTGPLFVHVKHNGNMELHVSATFQKYGNMWFRPVYTLWVEVIAIGVVSYNLWMLRMANVRWTFLRHVFGWTITWKLVQWIEEPTLGWHNQYRSALGRRIECASQMCLWCI